MNCKISIIIPSYNNAKYIKQCLDSCVFQTYKNIEIIVVDDCSSDNSVNLVKAYQKRDSRIRLIQNTKNQGVSKTRHIGILACSSDWITTLDSDDFYVSERKLEKEVETLKYHDLNVNIIAYSGIICVNREGENVHDVMSVYRVVEGDVFEVFLTRGCAIPRDFIFSKKLYFDIGGFDFQLPLYEDWDLKIRLAKYGSFYYSGISGIAYRQHNQGLSSVNKEKHLKWLQYVFDKNSKGLKNRLELNAMLMKRIKPSFLVRVYDAVVMRVMRVINK